VYVNGVILPRVCQNTSAVANSLLLVPVIVLSFPVLYSPPMFSVFGTVTPFATRSGIASLGKIP